MALWPDKAGLRASSADGSTGPGCCNKTLWTGGQAAGAYSTRLCRLGAERETPAGSGLGRTHSLACKLLAAASDHVSLPLS